MNLRRVVHRLLHLLSRVLVLLLLNEFCRILQSLGHLSVFLSSHFLNLNFFESAEQLVQVHGIGQIEEGEIGNGGDLGHHPISLLIGLLLYVLLVVLEANQVSLLYEVRFLIGGDLLDHHLVFLLELVVVA